MADNQVYDVTPLVGNQGTEGDAVKALIDLVYRTVQAESWYVLGGVNTIRAFYNTPRKRWYLSVYSDISRTDLDTLFNRLNNIPPVPPAPTG